MKQKIAPVLIIIRKLIDLSPQGAVFFSFVALMHLVFKVCLGLFVTIRDGYGFSAFVAPPQSLLFVASDMVYAFILSRLLDLLPYAKRSAIYGIVYVLTFLFLAGNFVIHMHFKVFLRYSLIMFNGAGATELTEYYSASLNVFSVSFIAIAAALVVIWFVFARRLHNKKIFAKSYVPAVIAAISFVTWQSLDSRLSAGQECWMLGDPTMEFISSTIDGIGDSYSAARLEEQLEGFSPPNKPIFGKYPTFKQYNVPAVKNANVLFLLFESVPANRTILFGDSKSRLKVFDRLRGSAISFKNVRTIFPATSRSFISYHCGTYPGTTLSTISKYIPGFNCHSIISLLKAQGYKTAFFTPSMFSYDNLHNTGLMNTYDEKKHFFDFQKEATSSGLLAQAVEEEMVSDRTLTFMKDSEKPFFALYFSFWTHAPYRIPQKDISHFDLLERFYITQEYLDGVYTKLIDDMDKAGLLDNTIIVMAADHGEAFGELHKGNYNHGGMVYEENTLIPFFIYVPGLNQEVVVDRLGSVVDFSPTLAALLDLTPDASWEGQNLLGDAYTPRPHLLFSRSAVVTNGIVDGNYKFFYDGATDEDFLFDLAADPTEQHNLAAKMAGQVKQYRSIVDKWLLYQNKKIVESQSAFRQP